MSTFERQELPFGWIGPYAENEVEIVSTKSDPPKIRLAVETNKVESNLGNISFNLRRPDGIHEEMAYVMGRLTASKQASALYLATRGPNDQQPSERVYIDDTVAFFRVPVIAPNLGTSERVTQFYSDDGRYCYNVQGDPTPEYPNGRIVQYDTSGPKWVAVAILRPEAL